MLASKRRFFKRAAIGSGIIGGLALGGGALDFGFALLAGASLSTAAIIGGVSLLGTVLGCLLLVGVLVFAKKMIERAMRDEPVFRPH